MPTFRRREPEGKVPTQERAAQQATGTNRPAAGMPGARPGEQVSPEAAAGGEIGLLEDGDIIDIDMDQYTISARVSEEEFARRRERQVMPKSWVQGGWLARYQHLVSSADEGAILRDQF